MQFPQQHKKLPFKYNIQIPREHDGIRRTEKRHIPYSVVKFDVESMGETRPAYQVLADFSEKNAPELTALGFHRERLTRFRKRYMWRSLSGRELSRFLEAQYAPAFRYGDNCIWNFLGGVKRNKR